MPPLLAALPADLGSMSVQALSTVVWAVSVLELDSDQAKRARQGLVAQMEMRLENFTMQELGQAMWALSAIDEIDDTASEEEAVLLMNAADVVTRKAGQTKTESAVADLPRIACALAKFGVWGSSTASAAMDNIAFRLSTALPKVKRWELAALIWSWEERPGAKPRNAAIAAKPAITSKNPRRPRKWVLEHFLDLLREEGALRNLEPSDIDRSPLGPDESWGVAKRQEAAEVSSIPRLLKAAEPAVPAELAEIS